MSDAYYDEKGELVVDFSGQQRSVKALSGRSTMTQYGKIDLASGYPSHLIWTTKDRRRIAIPNMEDSHLLNTIAFLRRRATGYKKQMAVAIMTNTSVQIKLFESVFIFEDDGTDWLEYAEGKAREIWGMENDVFLREYVPIFRYMLQEAYKRKILLEVDSGKLS